MLALAPDKTTAKRRLSQLQARYPLPAGVGLAQTFLQRVVIDKLELFMVGHVATLPAGAQATGSAASSGGYPVARAYFELLERTGLLLARGSTEPFPVRDRKGQEHGRRAPSKVFGRDAHPDQVRTSLSNGVALHSSWPAACDSALHELIERDRVLRSFRGEFAPRRLADYGSAIAKKLSPYTLEAYAFTPARAKHQVAGLFLFPQRPEHPLIFGFGAGQGLDPALAAASGEALQRLAFLWGEPLPSSPPPAAANADFHQEHYLYPPHQAVLRRWLSGHWPKWHRPVRAPDLAAVSFIDLTPRELQGGLTIAKASVPGALPLRFGVRSTHTIPHPIA